MTASFITETAVRAAGPGRYEAEIAEAWTLRPLPQGGVVTALALRAMADALGRPDQRVRTLHTTYVGQVAHGPVEIAVELLRTGRSMSHLRADVRNPGAPAGHVTTAVFGATREGFSFTDGAPPAVPLPHECPSFRDPPPPDVPAFPPAPFWETRLESRPAMGRPPWEGQEAERAEMACWYRFDEPPRLDDDSGVVDPLALVVVADTMPGAVGQKLGGFKVRPWFGPSVDLTVHLLDDCRSEWVLGHNTARFAGDGYASADMALWDCGPDCRGEPRLVAYATQLFFFTFM